MNQAAPQRIMQAFLQDDPALIVSDEFVPTVLDSSEKKDTRFRVNMHANSFP